MEGKVLPLGVLGGLAGTPVHLLQDLKELASDVRGVTVQHGGVAVKTPRRGESESKKNILQRFKQIQRYLFGRYGVDFESLYCVECEN